ncbi:hypothetical protein HUJ05_008853 [Dendroctonus ponderosae]|nr:hypothetical protein HUJ05_008853 [Dendroctonus ponderosae]
MYQPKKTDAFYYSLLFMRYLHYYPSRANESSWKIYRIISLFIRILNSFVWIECVLHFSMAVKDNVPVDISEDIVGFTGLANSMFLCIMFELNVKEWSRVFFHITDTSKFGMPPKMSQVIDKCNRFSWIYFLYCCTGIIIYGIINIVDPGPCERWNAEHNIHDVCRTLTPLWWPEDDIEPGLKTIIVICQLISCISYVPPSATLTYIIWEAGELIIAKIHHLKQLFESALDNDKLEIRRARLRFCIQYHQDIISTIEELNGAARKVCGQLSFVASIVFSCIGTQMLKEYSIHPMLHLIGYAMAVFLVCQNGQKIRDQTYDIQDAVYKARWYDNITSTTKDSQLIMLRCQKPLCMDAIPFGIFNFSLLLVIIKTSYSYLTLINKTS